METDVCITNVWYSPSGDVETVFVRPVTNSSEDSSPARNRSKSGSSTSDLPSESTQSLDDIAAELIGDEVFEVTEDEESLLGSAERRAKKQGRDPAVDPRFNDLDE